jgi:predicted permease
MARRLQFAAHMAALRHALVSLSRTPGFTILSLLTLTFGIGLNTAMFSLMNVMVLEPFPFDHPETLVHLECSAPGSGNAGFSVADYLDLVRSGSSSGAYVAYTGGSVSVSDAARPAELQDGLRVSAGFLGVLGIRPELGRGLLPADEVPGRDHVAMLSHDLWQRRFAGDPGVVGRTTRIDGETYEIVGVLPRFANDQRLIRMSGIFRPLAFTPAERADRSNRWLNVIGRRAAAMSAAQERAQVAGFGRSLAADHAKEDGAYAWRSVNLLGSTESPAAHVIMAMLLGLSGIVLLIACSNLANFVMARVIGRSHELAVRTALGASRLQLIAPFAAEALVLTAAGSVGALWVSVGAGRWLSAQSVATGGMPIDFPLDWRVLSFAALASVLTGLVFSIAPAWYVARPSPDAALKSGGRGHSPGRRHARLRQILLTVQFAMAMTLLAGAGFFVQGAANAVRMHLGWDSDNVVVGAFELPSGRYGDPAKVRAFDEKVIATLGRLPGVQAASLSYAVPYAGVVGPRPYRVDALGQKGAGSTVTATYNGVSGDFFRVTGTPLLTGRPFGATDTADSPPVAIINDTMARELFANQDPLGQRLAVAGDGAPRWARVVGVVADVRATTVYQRPVAFQVYQPFVQEPWQYANLAVRTDPGASGAVLSGIREAFAQLDPDLPLQKLMKASARVAESASDAVMLKKMLGAFALLGVLLAITGVYGIVERTVALRVREIGIRIAVGARGADIHRLILGFGLRIAATGAAIGILGALGLSRLVESVVPSMQADATSIMVASAGLLLGAAAAACYLPSRGATAVDPATILRSE